VYPVGNGFIRCVMRTLLLAEMLRETLRMHAMIEVVQLGPGDLPLAVESAHLSKLCL
jgi:hypothetical protein